MTKTTMLALLAILALGACGGEGFAADEQSEVDAMPAHVATDSGAPSVDAEPVAGIDAGRNCAKLECQLECEPGAKRPMSYDEPFVGCWCVSHRCIAWHDGPACSPNRYGCVVLPTGAP